MISAHQARTCRGTRGRSKRGVDYVQENGLKGQRLRQPGGAERASGATGRRPSPTRGFTARRGSRSASVFREVERPALRPLPPERFPFFHEAQRIVNRDGHVEVAKAYYSVPPEYLGRTRLGALGRAAGADLQPALRADRRARAARAGPVQHARRAHRARRRSAASSAARRGCLRKVRRHRRPHGHAWAEAMLQARGIEGVRVLARAVEPGASGIPAEAIERGLRNGPLARRVPPADAPATARSDAAPSNSRCRFSTSIRSFGRWPTTAAGCATALADPWGKEPAGPPGSFPQTPILLPLFSVPCSSYPGDLDHE